MQTLSIRSLQTRCAAVVGVGWVLFGCALGPDEGIADGAIPGGSGGGGGADLRGPDELAFADPSGDWLVVPPGSRHTLRLKAKPEGRYVVRFALLPTSDEPEVDDVPGAVLSTTTTETNETGEATVDLTAPTNPAIFTVRASADEATARLTVEVEEPGLRRVIVHPEYAGTRRPEYWIAGIHVGKPCSTLGDFTGKGEPSVTEAFERDPEVPGVPVSVSVAVTVRGDKMMSGCTDTQVPTEGMALVNVPIRDLPLLLNGDFSVALNLKEQNTAWDETLSESQVAALSRFRGEPEDPEDPKPSDMEALLNEMQEQAGPAGPDFALARASEDWDGIAETEFPGNVLSTHITTWFETGLESLAMPGSLAGGFRDSHLVIDTVAGIAAETAGLSVAEETASFEALAGDQLLLDAALSWHFGSLVTALASNAARVATSNASDVPSALAELLGCDKFSSTLAGSDGELYADCDESCGVTLCQDALEALWRKARATSSENASLMRISATASATKLSEDAKPLHFEGTWKGQCNSPVPQSSSFGLPTEAPSVSGDWTGGS